MRAEDCRIKSKKRQQASSDSNATVILWSNLNNQNGTNRNTKEQNIETFVLLDIRFTYLLDDWQRWGIGVELCQLIHFRERRVCPSLVHSHSVINATFFNLVRSRVVHLEGELVVWERTLEEKKYRTTECHRWETRIQWCSSMDPVGQVWDTLWNRKANCMRLNRLIHEETRLNLEVMESNCISDSWSHRIQKEFVLGIWVNWPLI